MRDEIRARAGLGLVLIIEYFRCFDCALAMTRIIGHSERNEMKSKNLKVDVSTNAQHDS